mmetsp:Transcript_28247/g.61842  ORF Transcript_28247/g.61842 Transcript_28247/m.61842 type:complete len:245 (-) Transcript_28247:460-1194(-)
MRRLRERRVEHGGELGTVDHAVGRAGEPQHERKALRRDVVARERADELGRRHLRKLLATEEPECPGELGVWIGVAAHRSNDLDELAHAEAVDAELRLLRDNLVEGRTPAHRAQQVDNLHRREPRAAAVEQRQREEALAVAKQTHEGRGAKVEARRNRHDPVPRIGLSPSLHQQNLVVKAEGELCHVLVVLVQRAVTQLEEKGVDPLALQKIELQHLTRCHCEVWIVLEPSKAFEIKMNIVTLPT